MIEAKCINQIDNIISAQVIGDYQFKDQERFGITILRNTFDDELRGLYWVLLDWVVDNKLYMFLPNADKWFNAGMHRELASEKLYCYVRFMTNWVEITWDKDGMKRITAKSTYKKRMRMDERSAHYDAVYTFLSTHIPTEKMLGFIKQHEAARKRLGKDY